MTFEVRPFEARTVSWWFRIRDEIDFEPSYQRKGIVWEEGRKAFLVDSILNDFDIPKLYFADFTYFRSKLNDSGKRFAIIDGKQRLSALFSFLGDELRLNPDFTLRDQPEVSYGGMFYSELRRHDPELAAKVENYNLPVMSVITDDAQAVQELFVRLNSGKPLTSAERRNAFPGLVPGLVQRIAYSPFFTTCIAFSNRGGAHEQAAAKLLLLELSGGGPVDLKRSTLDEMYSYGPRIFGEDVLSNAATDVLEGIGLMAQHFFERDPLLRTQGQLPVYYLVFRHGNLPDDARERIRIFHEARRSLARGEFPPPLNPGVRIPFVEIFRRYTAFMRSPNDARSVIGMAEMLGWFIRMTGSEADPPEFDYV